MAEARTSQIPGNIYSGRCRPDREGFSRGQKQRPCGKQHFFEVQFLKFSSSSKQPAFWCTGCSRLRSTSTVQICVQICGPVPLFFLFQLRTEHIHIWNASDSQAATDTLPVFHTLFSFWVLDFVFPHVDFGDVLERNLRKTRTVAKKDKKETTPNKPFCPRL